MTLSTWQLVVVGALAMVWAVVLGLPLVVDLVRLARRRSKAPRPHQRTRRSFAERTAATWWARPRPIRGFRSQEVVRKRLQILLGCAMATTTAMFLAIAFRGLFLPLFAVMLACLLLVVVVGVVVGQAEHTNLESQHQARRPEPAEGAADLQLPGLLGDLPLTEPDEVPTANPWGGPHGGYTIPTLADIADAFRTPDRSGFMFEPLNLDGESREAAGHQVTAQELSDVDSVEVPVDPALVAELGLDLPSDSVSDPSTAPAPAPRFQAAPEAGSRQASARARQNKRSRARPIQRDSPPEDSEKATRAIND